MRAVPRAMAGLGSMLLAGAAAAQPARAASQGDVTTMTCSDYLKAEQASDYTEGVTGKPGMDRLPADQASRVHDYCAAHPETNAGQAIQHVQAN